MVATAERPTTYEIVEYSYLCRLHACDRDVNRCRHHYPGDGVPMTVGAVRVLRAAGVDVWWGLSRIMGVEGRTKLCRVAVGLLRDAGLDRRRQYRVTNEQAAVLAGLDVAAGHYETLHDAVSTLALTADRGPMKDLRVLLHRVAYWGIPNGHDGGWLFALDFGADEVRREAFVAAAVDLCTARLRRIREMKAAQ